MLGWPTERAVIQEIPDHTEDSGQCDSWNAYFIRLLCVTLLEDEIYHSLILKKETRTSRCNHVKQLGMRDSLFQQMPDSLRKFHGK